jgi:riboflavin synthase
MFTGLIEAVGQLAERTSVAGGVRLRIVTPLARDLVLGDSLAVNGVCLTVASLRDAEMSADVGPETLRVTTLGSLTEGGLVNLERPLRADSRLGGHFVQGHVDAVGCVEEVRPEADFHWLTVSYPKELSPLIVPKGSIAVDGISLTVARLRADRFDVQLIPYTLTHTNLKAARSGDSVNLECDLVGKYVVRSMELRGTGD